eukprot:scaffold5729_cov105-Pinguiococcus_pyrenoidosus.AAC.1
MASRKALIALRIDDPLDAIPVHGANGIWALVATALFAKGDLLDYHFARDQGSGHGPSEEGHDICDGALL